MAMKVAVRIRPSSQAERSLNAKEIITSLEDNMVCLLDPTDSEYSNLRGNRSRGKTFVFNHVFSPKHSTQQDVFQKTTKDLIDAVLEGYNATVLAYGPTGTGKTYTMLGTDTEPGIMVLTLNDLYKKMDKLSDHQKYTVKMSYLEIYNEMIRDLLNPSSAILDLREDSHGIQVAGLTEYEALTTSEIMKMLSRGNKLRMCEPTAVNKTSSRSHAVLQVTVEQKSRVRNVSEQYKIAKLYMIDLAGSERAAHTQNTGLRLIEGAHINRSLLALGNCINALSEKGKSKSYVNYRDSKLTRLLKDSLGGNCKTVMIAHVSPASTSFEESKNTLSYADRAKSIKLKAKPNQYSVNYHVAQYQEIISDLREEINRLKSRSVLAGSSLRRNSEHNNVHSTHVIKKLQEELETCYNDLLEVRKEIIHMEDSTMQHSVEYQRHLLTIDEWNQEQARRQAKDEMRNKRSKSNQRSLRLASREKFTPNQEPADVTAAREEIDKIKYLLEEIEYRKKELAGRLTEQKAEKEFLEKIFSEKVSTEQQKAILDSLCKMHEIQIRNIELESTALIKEYLLEQKDLTIQRNQMRHNLIEEIVNLQKNIIEENHIRYPVNLELLYRMYKQQLTYDKDVCPLPTKDTKGFRTQVPKLPQLNRSLEDTDDSCSAADIPLYKQGKNKCKNSIDQDKMSVESEIDTRLPPIKGESISVIGSANTLSTLKITKNTNKKNVKEDTFVQNSQPLGELTKKISSPFDDNTALGESYVISRSYENRLQQRRLTHTIIDLDDESQDSIITTPYQNDDSIERKRSASASLIRERLSNRQKKLKKLKALNMARGKPSWNNNFNSRVIVAPGDGPTNKQSQSKQSERKTSRHVSNRYKTSTSSNPFDEKIFGKSKLHKTMSSNAIGELHNNDILSVSGMSCSTRGALGRI